MNLISVFKGLLGAIVGNDWVTGDQKMSSDGYYDSGEDFTNLSGALDNFGAKITGSRLTRAEQQANAFNAEQAELAYQRSLEADSTLYQRRVADMSAAGVNPMIAAGGISSGSVTSSPASSVNPGSGSFNLGSLLSFLMLPSQLKSMKAERNLMDANAKKAAADAARAEADASFIREQERGANIVNNIREATSQAQIESANLEPKLKALGADKIRKEMDGIEANIKVLAEQQNTEQEKAAYYQAAAMASQVNSYVAAAMLPYNQMLAAAKTQNERAQASLAAVHEAYQQGIIDSGYIQSMAREMAANAGKAENAEVISDIATALRTGKYDKLEAAGIAKSGPVSSNLLQAITVFLDNLNPLNGLLK